jgi:hypothetical protein
MNYPLELHAGAGGDIKSHIKEMYRQLYTDCGRNLTLFCAYTNIDNLIYKGRRPIGTRKM